MKAFVLSMLTLGMSVATLLPLHAADDAKKEKKKAAKAGAAVVAPKGIELSAEQTAQLEAINKEFAPKLEAVQKKLDAVLTPERKKAVQEATAAAKTAGKKGPELKAAVAAAVKLSEQEQKDVDAAQKELGELRKAAQEKLLGLLTAEQKEKIQPKKKAAK